MRRIESESVIAAFHATSRLKRRDIFLDEQLTPRTALEDANTPAPGWVGANWKGGTLLVGINPGGGGDEDRRNSTDDQLYSLLRAFRDADSDIERRTTFQEVSRSWIDIQKTHNIWRIIRAILEATGESEEEVAFMNILPFRTRMDKAAPVRVIHAAWSHSSKSQLQALAPKRIIALGKKAWDVLNRFEFPACSELMLFKRAIGDSYIPPESQELLSRLANTRA